MPVARYVLLTLGCTSIRRPYAIAIPDAYQPNPGDNYRALFGLDIEIFFGVDVGFHRLRLVCESCIDAHIGRLVLLPELRPTFVIMKRGAQ
ncbi:hypothetical protein SAMN04488595_101241 [Ralstonia sp. 25mfcol4.1]|nr:hypothetical protein SAMN04488595_101241 [Ralstonia sp. 25mfcol4.1]